MKWLTRLWKKLFGRAHRTVLIGMFLAQIHNADGTLASEELIALNGDTTVGNNNMLEVYFNSGTQITAWYIGLIANGSFSALSAADTMSSHAGWLEDVNYSQSTRVAWVPNAASAGVMTGASLSFSINATATIKGAFLTSGSAKSGTTGTLQATGTFSSPQSLSNGQTFTLTYQKALTPT